MGVGRFVCVALPFALTLASFISILIVMLAGVTNHNLDLFQVETQNFSVSTSDLQNFEDLLKRADHFSSLTTAALENANAASKASTSGVNITAADLGLADEYKVSLWNFCSVTGTNTTCSKAKFGWASSALNVTTIEALASSTAGVSVTLPTSLKDSLKTFTVVLKWTEIVYIIAVVACAAELLLGLFGFCSKVASCCTWLISGVSSVSIIAASILATVMASIVVGAIESSTKAYGVKASIDTSFLATTWIAVAFSIAASFCWIFTICCGSTEHRRSNRRRRGDDTEKLIPTGAYRPIGQERNGGFAGQQQGIYAPQYGVPTNNKPMRGNDAYEPYAHAAI